MVKKRAHFIGIAGMGMSAAAILLKSRGWEVGGSDAEAYPPGTTQLERHGIPFHASYKPDNIPKDADVIVVGMNTRLAPEHNEEVRAAHASGTRIVSFPELLGELTEQRETIVVAGSYGKSTIAALLAWLLSRSDADAGWFVGAAPHGMEPSHLGTHPVFIMEGDEYPTSHGDPRPKFAHYRARDCLITAATHDHVNVYKTHEDFLTPFRALAASVPKDGLLLLCGDEPNARALAACATARTVFYGLVNEAEWSANNIVRNERTSFDLTKNGKTLGRLETTLWGEHNIQNIVGAAAVLLEKKLLTPEQIARALKGFKGLARRLDRKTTRSSLAAYEAFGSSREKLRAAIAAVRAAHPDKRLVVVFEPHTFSWRNKKMLHWYDDAFESADMIVLYEPTVQGAGTHEQSSHEEILARLQKAGVPSTPVKAPEEALAILKNEVREGDVLLLSSSGSMDGLIEKIPEWLDTAF